MDLVLDGPVAPDVGGQVLRCGLAGGQAGDAQGGHRGPDGHGLVLTAPFAKTGSAPEQARRRGMAIVLGWLEDQPGGTWGKRERPLPVLVRGKLGEWLSDGQFAGAYGVRGKPGWPPSRLALVTIFQKAENLTGRQAAEHVRTRIDWKYALGLDLADPGFGHSVLSEFRARVAAGGLDQVVLDTLLKRLAAGGLLHAGGKMRTDSAHVISAVRDLNRLELAGESVRACLEQLAVAAPQVVAQVLDDSRARRYAARVDTWRMPAAAARQDELALAYGRDGRALLTAVYAAAASDPDLAYLARLRQAEVLRVVLVQNYLTVVDEQGREVIKRREAQVEGLPPGRSRIASPYDTDARRGVKRDTFWNGYKVHVTETCDTASGSQHTAVAPPHLVVNVETTDATVPDNQMTEPVHAHLDQRGLLPGEHLVDSGYPSAELLVTSQAGYGITLVTPVLADTSPQARAGAGFDRSAFTIDFEAQQATCPQGRTSSSRNPVTQRGASTIVITFSKADCRPCPARELCTTSASQRRQLTCTPGRSTRRNSPPGPPRAPTTSRPDTRCALASKAPSARPWQ